MTEKIRIGDWVFLDVEDGSNRWIHKVFQSRFHLEFDKKYRVVGVRDYIVSLEPKDDYNRHYSCYAHRVRLASPMEEVVLWK